MTTVYTVSDDRFEVVGNELKLKEGVSLNYEQEQQIQITVTAETDNQVLSQTFTLMVENTNDAPTAILLTNNTVDEKTPGAVVGSVVTYDEDTNETFTYGINDERFEITSEGVLKLKNGQTINYDDAAVFNVEITATDSAGASLTQAIALIVNQKADALATGVTLTNNFIPENQSGQTVGVLNLV